MRNKTYPQFNHVSALENLLRFSSSKKHFAVLSVTWRQKLLVPKCNWISISICTICFLSALRCKKAKAKRFKLWRQVQSGFLQLSHPERCHCVVSITWLLFAACHSLLLTVPKQCPQFLTPMLKHCVTLKRILFFPTRTDFFFFFLLEPLLSFLVFPTKILLEKRERRGAKSKLSLSYLSSLKSLTQEISSETSFCLKQNITTDSRRNACAHFERKKAKNKKKIKHANERINNQKEEKN